MNLFDEILRGQGGVGGKIKPEQLPDGYPYKTVKEYTVEHNPDAHNDIVLEGFPAFEVGDTVSVKINGVEYSLTAFYDEGAPVIGDTYIDVEDETGEYGWCLYSYGGEVGFFSYTYLNVSWMGFTVTHMDKSFLPMATVNDRGAISFLDWYKLNSPEIVMNINKTTFMEFLGLCDNYSYASNVTLSCITASGTHSTTVNGVDLNSRYGYELTDTQGKSHLIYRYKHRDQVYGDLCLDFSGEGTDLVLTDCYFDQGIVITRGEGSRTKYYNITVDDSGTLNVVLLNPSGK